MLRFPPWKVASVLLVCLAGLVFTLPNLFPRDDVANWPAFLPRQQITLGLDLQGGSHLLLEVDTAAVVRERLASLEDEVRDALRQGDTRIGYRNLDVRGDRVTFDLRDPSQAEAAQAALAGLNTDPNAPEIDLGADGGRFSLALTDQARQARVNAAVTQSLEIVRRRIDELGTREPTIQRQGADRILVQVPGERNPESIKRLLGRTARLSFHMVDPTASSDQPPAGTRALPSEEAGPDGRPFRYVVQDRVVVSGENLTDAQPSFQTNEPVVSFTFDGVGARRFGDATRDNVGQSLAIVLDDRVISAPRINEPILGGSGIISGQFTVESANELAVLLRAGALPAPLAIIEERSVGAELGADSIRAGVIACVLAFALVTGFMVVYYGVFGLIADLGLVVGLVLIMGALSVLGATLTLPGIAGIVLTIGTAVDANVLIYERIREEVQTGKTPLAALDSGFREAMRTIIDSNLTNLIAAVILFSLGTGPIRGFAVTLAIGIVTTMFTAVTFTRMLFAIWYRRVRPAALPV